MFSRRRALVALAAAYAAGTRSAAAQALTPLLLAGVPEDSITPVLYAARTGLFRRAGLDVQVQAQRSGPAVMSGVAGGSYQIGKASVSPLVIAHAKGIPLVVVAPAGIYNATDPISGLLVRTDAAFKTAADLNGRSVAVLGLTDINSISMRLWSDQNGGDSATFKLVEIPTSEMGPAVESGRVDACLVNEPSLAVALAGGKLKAVGRPYSAVAPRFMYTAWFADAAYVAAHRATIEAFARALREAAAFANGHRADTVEALAAFTAIDPGIIAKMTRVEAGTALDPRLLQPVVDATAKYKQIPAAFDARELLAAGLS